ncbi:MAG: hypothetical protein K2I96_08660 [Lachnospiraceae bacterium]|nr:hypothetical protein [Lachnospiraceae bacterium]
MCDFKDDDGDSTQYQKVAESWEHSVGASTSMILSKITPELQAEMFWLVWKEIGRRIFDLTGIGAE